MTLAMRVRLSAMMFAQYFVWGAWFVTLGAYLNAQGFDAMIGAIYATQGYGAIITPLFLGAFADRYFSAQRLMGVLHLVGAAIMAALATVPDTGGVFFVFALAYMLLYMPTLPLSNAVAMNALEDTEKQFPAIRVLGTIGWIVAGLLVGFLQAEQTNIPMLIAAAGSVALGLYSFTLPDTPPRAKAERQSLMAVTGLDIITTTKDRAFWVFILCSLLIVIPLSFYYAYTNTFLIEVGVERAAAIQTLGQMSEIVFMLLLPLFFVRLGVKWVLVVGMLAWTARYVLFAYGVGDMGPIMPMLLAGILLHGVCYDFFFVAGQVWVDTKFEAEKRARAQSFLALVTLGVGQVIGSNLANVVYVANTVSANEHDWRAIWLLPAALAVGVTVLFLLLFRERSASATPAPAQ